MPADDIQGQLVKYLKDVHGTEENAIQQLRTGAESVEDQALAHLLREHLAETEEHEQLVRQRLEALDAAPSTLKDTASKGMAAIAGAVSGAAPDTTGKVAIQAFATEHTEIASYRMLRTVALQAGDHETVQVADRILTQEQEAAAKLDGLLERVALTDLPQSTAA